MSEENKTSKTTQDLQTLRVDYGIGELNESQIVQDAIKQFAKWFSEARMNRPGEPNTMTLATADAAGVPSARIVLLKDYDARGFTFYGNYESQKALELAANPRAALVFFWPVLERQVRINGIVTKVSRQESKAYYDIRPRAARIGAWASKQSRVIPSRDALEQIVKETDQKFPSDQIPLPDHWGGWRLAPTSIEFWQGGSARLHDRIRYTRDGNGWKIERLAP